MRQSGEPEQGWGDTGSATPGGSVTWFHVPASGALTGVCLSPAPVRYAGHWIGGGMKPCVGSTCEWCRRGIGSQQRWVLCLWDQAVNVEGLLELGRWGAEQVRQASEVAGCLRGLELSLARSEPTSRARVKLASWRAREDLKGALPQGLDVPAVLRDLWSRD